MSTHIDRVKAGSCKKDGAESGLAASGKHVSKAGSCCLLNLHCCTGDLLHVHVSTADICSIGNAAQQCAPGACFDLQTHWMSLPLHSQETMKVHGFSNVTG